jgi:general secretion pathway protein A
MYASFYGLKQEPFNVTPDPEFLFLSPSHKEALGSIIYGVKQRKGFIVVTGEVGVGKTTILRSYLEGVNRKQLKVIYVFNPGLTFGSLLQIIGQELGIDVRTPDVTTLVSRLHLKLIEVYMRGKNVALLIDEAQNVPVETLENLRMLSNLETSKDKLIQIVLIGQPEFETALRREELRQLRQRVAVHCRVSPLSRRERAWPISITGFRGQG